MKKEKSRLRDKADKLAYQKYLNPICEICGKKANQLHHFYPKSCYNHIRFSKENLISLCVGCHFRLTHQDKRLEDIIREKRGEKWFRALQEIAYQKPKSSYLTSDYYKKVIEQLNG